MPLYVNTFFEKRVEQLFDLARRVDDALSSAGIDYGVAGGLAAYVCVEAVEPDAGRLTKNIDIAVRREDLPRIAAAVGLYGLRHLYAAGLDMLVQVEEPSARRAVHLIFAGEKVRPEYPEPAPDLAGCRTIAGIRVLPLDALVRMKLTSFRTQDETHLKDLDRAGLIAAEVEARLSPLLRDRLARVRARLMISRPQRMAALRPTVYSMALLFCAMALVPPELAVDSAPSSVAEVPLFDLVGKRDRAVLQSPSSP